MQFHLPLTMSFFLPHSQQVRQRHVREQARYLYNSRVQNQSSCVDLKSFDSLYRTRWDIDPASPLTDIFYGNHTMSASVKWISCLFYFKSITLQGNAAHNTVYLETDFGGSGLSQHLSICLSPTYSPPPPPPPPHKALLTPLPNESYSGVWSLHFKYIYWQDIYICIPKPCSSSYYFFNVFLIESWCVVCVCVWMCGFLFRKLLFLNWIVCLHQFRFVLLWLA